MKSYITVHEILQRKHFENIEIVAGNEGTHRLVKWVHVVEVVQIQNLLRGHELILTTGLGWKENKSLFIHLLKQLIESHASGLCIEVDERNFNIPQDAIHLANEFNFPIILFREEVPFVEITKDIHSTLINNQYQLISSLEQYSNELNKKLLAVGGHDEILTVLHTYLDVQVVVVFKEAEIQFSPSVKEYEKELILNKLSLQNGFKEGTVAKQPVYILGREYAEIIIVSKERELTEYDHLILDRTVTALSQNLLRVLYVEEKNMVEESKWMSDWLEGVHSSEKIREHLAQLEPNLKINGGLVCVSKHLHYRKGSNTDATYLKILLRTIFEQFGFYLFSVEVRTYIVFILGNKRSVSDWKDRLIDAIQRIDQIEETNKIKLPNFSFVIGKFVPSLDHIHKSYQTAKETLVLKEKLPKENRHYFYEDLHLFRIISLINKHIDLQEIVLEYLEPVIEYDKKYNGQLLETLKIYLTCNGSKQETAKRLFIVRQTLYHRIDKLELLLGSDFMKSEKRLAIELMILAHDYLQTNRDDESQRIHYEI